MTRPSDQFTWVRQDRPAGFVLREGRKGLFIAAQSLILHCENIPLAKLAERYGTPLYVYSATTILQRLTDFQDAFHTFRILSATP